MSFSTTIRWRQSLAASKKKLVYPLVRISLSLFSKTISFAILCSRHRWERAALGNREHFHLKYFYMTLQCARPRRGKRCWREWNANEAVPQRGPCRRVWIRVIRELSLIMPSREGREEGGRGGGARGREKHWVIKGQRKPWWSSRASRCFEIKASFEDVKIWFPLCW